MAAASETCPRCGGGHVIPGQLEELQFRLGSDLYFRASIPVKNRFLNLVGMRFAYLIPKELASLCVDCGLCWAAVDPTQLQASLRARGTPEYLKTLGLSQATGPMADEELDGPL